MKTISPAVLLFAALSLLLVGCNGSSSSSNTSPKAEPPAVQQPDTPDDGDDKSDDTDVTNSDFTSHPIETAREGDYYDKCLTVEATGDSICITVFEPTELTPGTLYPLVLNGPGYGGSRTKTPSGMISRLRDNGYYVITMDPRGFGESSGTVRVMDPEYYGLDMVAVLDWAEDLPGLRRDPDGNMRVGSFGGSYGGMFQLLLAGADSKHRLRVLAPDITPHDLNYSLNNGDVVKSGWGLLLVAGGEANNLPTDELQALADNPDPSALVNKLQTLLGHVGDGDPLRQDTTLFEILLKAALDNKFDATAKNYFDYHSVSYFCDGEQLQQGLQQFLLPTSIPDQLIVPPTPYPAMNVLLTQGMRDALFNYNNGYANYQCLKKAGGDVRLLSHQGGHILPISVESIPTGDGSNAKDALDPFYAAINLPEFQGPGGSEACGPIAVADANFAWFQQYLQMIPGAADKVITSGKDFCMSIADGDAVALKEIPHGGTSFDIDAESSPLNGVVGILGSLLGSMAQQQLSIAQPIYTEPANDNGATTVVAGFPQMHIAMNEILGIGDAACSSIPDLPLGIGVGCDPILYLGIGIKRAGSQAWDTVDAQLTPVRGFGEHKGDMNAISVRLQPGDQLGFLAYAFTAQYPLTWSRDLLLPALSLSGNIELPFIDNADITPVVAAESATVEPSTP